MINKKPAPLNLPNKKDQFEAVPFVHDMTQHQLKVLVKRIWLNIQELSNILDYKHKDISIILDNVLDGKPIDKKLLVDRYTYGQYKGFVIRFDSKENNFAILDQEFNTIEDNIASISFKNIKKARQSKDSSPKVTKKPNTVFNILTKLIKSI